MLTQTKLHAKKHMREMEQREKAKMIARHGPHQATKSDRSLGIRVERPEPIVAPAPAPVHNNKRPSFVSKVLSFFQRRRGQ